MIFAADIMSLQRSQTEVLVELFSKSSWGYGGKAPVTLNNKMKKSIEAQSRMDVRVR